MRLLATILLLTIFPASAIWSGVSTPVHVGRCTATHPFLGTQFDHFVCIGDSTAVCVVAQTGASATQTSWMSTADAGQNWTVVNSANIDRDGYLSDHHSIAAEISPDASADSGIHVVFRLSTSSNPLQYRLINPPYTAATDTSTYNALDGSLNTYLGEVAVVDSNIWVVQLNAVTDSLLRVLHSDDNFATETAHRIATFATTETTQNAIRAGIDIDTSGNPYVVVCGTDLTGTDGFYLCHYNGSSWDSTEIYADESYGAGDRQFDFAVCNGVIYVCWFEGAGDSIVVAYGDTTGFTTMNAADIVPDADFSAPQLAVYGERPNQALYMIYLVQDGAQDYVCMKALKGDTWTDSVVISSATHDPWYSTVPSYVPSSWHKIPVFYEDDGGTDSLWYVEVDADLHDTLMTGYPYKDTITSLPFTIDEDMDSTAFVLSGNLHATGNGITIEGVSGNNLVHSMLYLGYDTLFYGEGDGDSVSGVTIQGTTGLPTDFIVQGGAIVHNASSGTVTECYSIWIRGGRNVVVRDVDVTVKGQNGTCLDGGGAWVSQIEIDGGTWQNNCTMFDSRCAFDACVIKVDHLYLSTLVSRGDSLHYYIHDITITNGPHAGIYAEGYSTGAGEYGIVNISDCSITTDARNDNYSYPSGNVCFSAENAYAIVLDACDSGTVVSGNTISSGSSYGGSRGFLMENCRGASTDPILIHDNTIDVHEGPSAYYGENVETYGLRIRYAPGVIRVYDNTIICTADTATATDNYGFSVHPVRVSTGSSGTDVLIYNNRIQAKTLTGGTEVCAVTFDGIDYPNTYELRYNNITTAGTVYKFGEVGTQDIGPTGVTIRGDTVGYEGTTIDDTYTFYLGHLSNAWLCYDNVAHDIVYQGATAYDDITFASNGTLDLAIQKTVTITVTDTLDTPLEGASVWVVNAYGDTVGSGASNGSGVFVDTVNYWWESRTETDSTAFNDFTYGAAHGGDTATTSFTVSYNHSDTTLAVGESYTPSVVAQTTGAVQITGGVTIE